MRTMIKTSLTLFWIICLMVEASAQVEQDNLSVKRLSNTGNTIGNGDSKDYLANAMNAFGVPIQDTESAALFTLGDAVSMSFEAAKNAGLDGRWIVQASTKDGVFSRAQIGQEPGDLISILPPENRSYVPMM